MEQKLNDVAPNKIGNGVLSIVWVFLCCRGSEAARQAGKRAKSKDEYVRRRCATRQGHSLTAGFRYR